MVGGMLVLFLHQTQPNFILTIIIWYYLFLKYYYVENKLTVHKLSFLFWCYEINLCICAFNEC
jgi:hypothetical protein